MRGHIASQWHYTRMARAWHQQTTPRGKRTLTVRLAKLGSFKRDQGGTLCCYGLLLSQLLTLAATAATAAAAERCCWLLLLLLLPRPAATTASDNGTAGKNS